MVVVTRVARQAVLQAVTALPREEALLEVVVAVVAVMVDRLRAEATLEAAQALVPELEQAQVLMMEVVMTEVVVIPRRLAVPAAVVEQVVAEGPHLQVTPAATMEEALLRQLAEVVVQVQVRSHKFFKLTLDFWRKRDSPLFVLL